LIPEEFDKLLFWLSPDRETAGKKYEEIRRQLIRYFTCWGCSRPEDLADITIDRVVPWMESRGWEPSTEPIRVFFGFARNVRRETNRKEEPGPIDSGIAQPVSTNATPEKEQDFACLEACIASLSATEADLIRHYYQYDQADKIKKRRELAKNLGIGMNALRIQAWKIRGSLRSCLDECVAGKHVN